MLVLACVRAPAFVRVSSVSERESIDLQCYMCDGLNNTLAMPGDAHACVCVCVCVRVCVRALACVRAPVSVNVSSANERESLDNHFRVVRVTVSIIPCRCSI